jgi:hypothetical protein
MSSYLYGRLSEKREETTPSGTLVFAEQDGTDVAPPGKAEAPKATDTIAHWQDILAALVPAEVLAIHALAMTLGTTTTGSGADATTVITSSTEMTWVFWGMVVAAAFIYVTGARSLSLGHVGRAVLGSVAFVLWTMIQPSTAFDALGLDLSAFLRVMIAIGGAVVVAVLANVLASAADKAGTESTG